MVFGDAKGVARLIGGKPQIARADGGTGQRRPCPGGVVVASRAVQRDPCAGADFIAEKQRDKKVATVKPPRCLGHGHSGRQGRATGVAFGQAVAIMGVIGVDHHAAC